MIYVMFAMAISSSNGGTSITTAEFSSRKACEDAKILLVENFTRVYGGFGGNPVSGAPELKIQCLPKGE